ncbi:MAG: hypothetical protein ACLQRH_01180 [Acidimicrobiales bacterium]
MADDSPRRSEGGFTLIELLIVTLVLPMVIGAIAVALVAVFSLQGSVSGRITGSSDAQLVSSNFVSDVQDASMIIAPSPTPGAPSGQSPGTCGTGGTEVLSLQSVTSSGTPTEISYLTVPEGSTYALVRNVCQNGSLTPTSTSTVSNNAPSSQTVSVTCASTLTVALAGGSGATTLSVSPLPTAVASGDTIQVGSGGTTFTASAASAGATSLTATPVGSSPAFPLGTSVVDSKWATPNINCGAATGWISTAGVTGVNMTITEPNTNAGLSPYTYTLVGVPAANSSYGQSSTLATPPSTSCNFATAGTGTYASEMCFVDFTQWNDQTTDGLPTCSQGATTGRLISSYVANTPFTLQFCLSVSSVDSNGHAITGTNASAPSPSSCNVIGYDDIAACPLPTYVDAFLGNNINGTNFYTGVVGEPALYTAEQGSTSTITITGIQVFDQDGNPATGWDLVTGDAETTDTGESITWTTTATSGLPPSLYLLPNSPTSPVGNACDSTPPTYNILNLTGIGTTTVECSATQSSLKTGTVMLEAAQPTGLKATLVGTGLQAVFVGLLLQA